MKGRRAVLRPESTMFFVFEGIDGCGKSTQARLLQKHLKETRALDALLLREPGGTQLGEKLRDLVLNPRWGDLAAETELFIFMAARSHLIRTRILPALASGRVVISDRFLWSSVVYQGLAAGILPREIFRIGRLALAGVKATRIFVLDVDPRTAFGRVKRRNRMEERGIAFQERVRQGFLSLAERFPRRGVVIEGRGSPEDVHARVIARLPKHGWSQCSSR